MGAFAYVGLVTATEKALQTLANTCASFQNYTLTMVKNYYFFWNVMVNSLFLCLFFPYLDWEIVSAEFQVPQDHNPKRPRQCAVPYGFYKLSEQKSRRENEWHLVNLLQPIRDILEMPEDSKKCAGKTSNEVNDKQCHIVAWNKAQRLEWASIKTNTFFFSKSPVWVQFVQGKEWNK